MHIRLVSSDSLDHRKWDALVDATPHPKLYGRAWYLDAMAGNSWLALVADDYVYGIPLMVKKFAFIKLVRPPYLCRQMGPYFTDAGFLEKVNKEVLDFFKKAFLLTNHLVNESMSGPVKILTERQNHILWLGKEYEEIASSYNRNTHRNVKKALNAGIIVEMYYDLPAFVRFMQENDQTGTIKKISSNISRMAAKAMEMGTGHITVARSGQAIVAMAFHIVESDRVYFNLCASSESGKATNAMYLVIDHIIKTNAGTPKYLDFTGSNIMNIARRNTGFGANPEKHYYLKLNRFTVL